MFAQSTLCDSTLWQHVYSPARLQPVIQPCVTITGVVGQLLPPALTADGDYHIYILPDTQYTWMIHYGNPSNWNNDGFFPGYLNVEIVCAGTTSDTAAIAACHNFSNQAYVPNTGEYVRVVAPFCFDNYHKWNEMHPVTSITIIGGTGVIDEGNTFLNDLKLFPQPAGNELNLSFAFAPHQATYIRVFNFLGREVADYQMAETSVLTLNTHNWPSGEYLYTISQDKGTLKSGRFTVVH